MVLHPTLLNMKGSSDISEEHKVCSNPTCNPCSTLKILLTGQVNLLTAGFGEKLVFVEVL